MLGAVENESPEIRFTDSPYRINIRAGTVILCHVSSQSENQIKTDQLLSTIYQQIVYM